MVEMGEKFRPKKPPEDNRLPDDTELKIIELQKHYKLSSKKMTLVAAVDLLDQHRKSEIMYARKKGEEWQAVQIKH